VSWDLANEKWLDGDEAGLLGQFASGGGLRDLSAYVQKDARAKALHSFLKVGAVEVTPDLTKDLERAAASAPSDVASTASAMLDLLEGQEFAMIVNGHVPDKRVEKFVDDSKQWLSWKAVDLDGTLAQYDGDVEDIGPPIPAMVERVKAWLAAGETVKIFTARMAHDPDGLIKRKIQDWTEEHLGQRLEVTNAKDPGMTELWDDRAMRVERNTGELKSEKVLKGEK